MASKKKYACKTAACRTQRKKFGTAAKKSNVVCHKETNSVAAYKKCMSREMKANLGSSKKKAKAPAKKCAGRWASGSKKGKLKPGYTYVGAKKGGCPVKAG